MKTDLYTKFILTVIAVGLFWIGIQLTPIASADRQITDDNIAKVNNRYIGAAVPVEMK